MDTDLTRSPAGDRQPTSEAVHALAQALASGQRKVALTGLKGAARAWVLAQLTRGGQGPFVCVVADDERADELATDLAFFADKRAKKKGPSSPHVLRLPEDDILPYEGLSADKVAVTQRLASLFHLWHGAKSPFVVVSARALARRYLPLERMDKAGERIAVNTDLDRDVLARRLVDLGYQPVPLVEDPGTFAVRGGIVDVFSPMWDQPVRVEFFGDTVESMKLFEPDSQRTSGTLDELFLCPAREILPDERAKAAGVAAVREAAEAVNMPSSQTRELIDAIQEGRPLYGEESLFPGFYEKRLSSLFDYLGHWSADPIFFLDDPVEVERALIDLKVDLEREWKASLERGELGLGPEHHYLSGDAVRALLGERRVVRGYSLLVGGPDERPIGFHYGQTASIRAEIQSHHGEDGALAPLARRLREWRDAGVYVGVACGSPAQVDRLKRLLLEREVMVKAEAGAFPADPGKAFEPSVAAHLFAAGVSQGFVAPEVAVLAEEDIFGQRTRKVSRRKKLDASIQAFKELKEGDLVVHVDYGIGRYAGMQKMDIRGVTGDVLVLEYAGRDKVYLPVARMRLLQKFTGADAEKTPLDKLGSGSWEKRKKAVKEHLLKMAAELLQLYAARKAHPGISYSAPDAYFHQFEADFEWEETPDQEKAIADVVKDMTSPMPMDRLVVGDVGYGKTEVALRAAFKAVQDHKQVAVLVPTTILAAQHLRTFKDRFKDYPVHVDMVSRYRTAKENKDVLTRLREGKVDIVIGTHKLLGSEVEFKDLGLLVIDEEQRFGVKHKEKLKRFRSQIDVLTMTATPIPRTLSMSMSGLRDLSIIATPPADRKAIRTFVQRFEPEVVAEAIRTELRRGGQVYFVHNRVESIEETAKWLRELVPEARFAVAHGQMEEGELEKVMSAFIERQYDVLVSSTIIESGIDIPAANTIIVNRADTFGLAQLYQIRGRVGRSKERAYAWLLIPGKKAMTRDAARRLEVLQSFTELGAGFSIASHDLEIRGAGNLLGPDQSGSIAAVGFDLYSQLMDEAVRELKGEPPSENFDPDVNLPLPAYIPDDYVPDVHLRLLFYKRFSQLANDDELSDLRAELVDRFGELPVEVDNLSEVMTLKADMRKLRLRTLETGPGRVVFTVGSDAELEPAKVIGLVQRSRGAYKLTPENKLVYAFQSRHKALPGQEPNTLAQGAELLDAAKKVLKDLHGCQKVVMVPAKIGRH